MASSVFPYVAFIFLTECTVGPFASHAHVMRRERQERRKSSAVISLNSVGEIMSRGNIQMDSKPKVAPAKKVSSRHADNILKKASSTKREDPTTLTHTGTSHSKAVTVEFSLRIENVNSPGLCIEAPTNSSSGEPVLDTHGKPTLIVTSPCSDLASGPQLFTAEDIQEPSGEAERVVHKGGTDAVNLEWCVTDHGDTATPRYTLQAERDNQCAAAHRSVEFKKAGDTGACFQIEYPGSTLAPSEDDVKCLAPHGSQLQFIDCTSDATFWTYETSDTISVTLSDCTTVASSKEEAPQIVEAESGNDGTFVGKSDDSSDVNGGDTGAGGGSPAVSGGHTGAGGGSPAAAASGESGGGGGGGGASSGSTGGNNSHDPAPSPATGPSVSSPSPSPTPAPPTPLIGHTFFLKGRDNTCLAMSDDPNVNGFVKASCDVHDKYQQWVGLGAPEDKSANKHTFTNITNEATRMVLCWDGTSETTGSSVGAQCHAVEVHQEFTNSDKTCFQLYYTAKQEGAAVTDPVADRCIGCYDCLEDNKLTTTTDACSKEESVWQQYHDGHLHHCPAVPHT